MLCQVNVNVLHKVIWCKKSGLPQDALFPCLHKFLFFFIPVFGDKQLEFLALWEPCKTCFAIFVAALLVSFCGCDLGPTICN